MTSDRLPFKYLDSLNLNHFAFNQRSNLPPNLWCLCNNNLSPQILSISDQHVTFSLCVNCITFGMAAVYASNCHYKGRNLWNILSQNLSDHVFPWCIVGDFNAIQGAHEHSGSHSPNRVHMLDFPNWSNFNNLIDIPSKGNYFTRSNGREGRDFIQRRLDRAFCNQLWISNATNMYISTLNRIRYDHFIHFYWTLISQMSNTSQVSYFLECGFYMKIVRLL